MKRREEGGLAQGGRGLPPPSRGDCNIQFGGQFRKPDLHQVPFLKAAPKRKSWKQFFRFSGRGYCPVEARLERGKLNFFGALSGGKNTPARY